MIIDKTYSDELIKTLKKNRDYRKVEKKNDKDRRCSICQYSVYCHPRYQCRKLNGAFVSSGNICDLFLYNFELAKQRRQIAKYKIMEQHKK
ncbi:MAG: hypothetical protein KAW12_07050 [Candidatus Aminicenantes bacterium]|nr:hypothetical protein [Candidatus Aminicenantes bacterium]